MDIRRATAADTELLIRVRLDFLADQRPLSAAQAEELAGKLRDFYPAHIEKGDFVAILGFVNGEVCSSAFLSYMDYPPNDLVPGVRRALAANIYTYPARRGRGYASQVVAALAETARLEGAAILDLFATEAGKHVYDKLGFAVHPDTPMRLDLAAWKGGRA